MTLLADSSTGLIMPRGSNVRLRVDKHPLLESSFFSVGVCDTITLKVSVSVSQRSLDGNFIQIKILQVSFFSWVGR